MLITESLTIEEWRRKAPGRRARIEKALAGFNPPRRQKPRSAFDAEFLRRIGTLERLIGSVADKRN